MKFRNTLFAIAALAALPALAQTIGTVTTVNGVATVTTGSSGAAIAPGAVIMHGSRVVTTSTGSVTLRLNNGCTVTVPPGHGVTVLSTQTCEQLTQAIRPVTTTVTTSTTTAMVPAGNVFANSGAVPIGAGLLFGAGLLMWLDDNKDGHISGR